MSRRLYKLESNNKHNKPDWQLEAEEMLRNYGQWKRAETVQNLKDQIESLNIKLYSSKTSHISHTSARGGKGTDNSDLIDKRDRLKNQLNSIELDMQAVERSLNQKALTADELTALDVFYINPSYGESFIQILMGKINLDKTRAYEIVNLAILKFAINMTGCITT